MADDDGTRYLLVGVDYQPFPRLRKLFGLATSVRTPLAEARDADFRTTRMMQEMFDDLVVEEVRDGDHS